MPDRYTGPQNLDRISMKKCAQLYGDVLALENEFEMPPLFPDDAFWEERLSHSERFEIQRELVLAYVNRLAVWDENPGPIRMLSCLSLKTTISPSTIFSQEGYETMLGAMQGLRPEQIKHALDRGPIQWAPSTETVTIHHFTMVPFVLLKMIEDKLGAQADHVLSGRLEAGE